MRGFYLSLHGKGAKLLKLSSWTSVTNAAECNGHFIERKLVMGIVRRMVSNSKPLRDCAGCFCGDWPVEAKRMLYQC